MFLQQAYHLFVVSMQKNVRKSNIFKEIYTKTPMKLIIQNIVKLFLTLGLAIKEKFLHLNKKS